MGIKRYTAYLNYVVRHKWFVSKECFKRGLIWRGILHDLSKFLPSEFIPYAKFFYTPKGEKNVIRDKMGYYKPTDTGKGIKHLLICNKLNNNETNRHPRSNFWKINSSIPSAGKEKKKGILDLPMFLWEKNFSLWNSAKNWFHKKLWMFEQRNSSFQIRRESPLLERGEMDKGRVCFNKSQKSSKFKQFWICIRTCFSNVKLARKTNRKENRVGSSQKWNKNRQQNRELRTENTEPWTGTKNRRYGFILYGIFKKIQTRMFIKECPRCIAGNFDWAWLLHQKRNKHHWQYFILPQDTDGIKLLEIPEKYIKEMLNDWVGAGKAQGHFSPIDKPMQETIKWYKANKSKMQLHPKTRKEIEALIKEWS